MRRSPPSTRSLHSLIMTPLSPSSLLLIRLRNIQGLQNIRQSKPMLTHRIKNRIRPQLATRPLNQNIRPVSLILQPVHQRQLHARILQNTQLIRTQLPTHHHTTPERLSGLTSLHHLNRRLRNTIRKHVSHNKTSSDWATSTVYHQQKQGAPPPPTSRSRTPTAEQTLSASRLVPTLTTLNAARSHQTSPINNTNTIDLHSLQHIKRTKHQTSNRQNLSSHSRRSRRIRPNKPRTNSNHHNSRQRNHTTTSRRPPRLIQSSLHKRPSQRNNSSQRSRLSRRKRHNKTYLTNSIIARTTEQIIPRHATLSALTTPNPISPQHQGRHSEQHNHGTTRPTEKKLRPAQQTSQPQPASTHQP